MDYFFMSQVDEKASANPIIVMVDERTARSTHEPSGTKAWARTTTWSGLSKVEEAGQTVGEFVPKKQIKGKTNVKLKCDDVIMKWMIRWGAMVVSGCMVGKDGRTSLRAEKGQSMQSTSSHVRRASLVQADPRAERALG